MQSPEHYTIAQVADILSVSKETLRRWDKNGTLVPQRQTDNNYRLYSRDQLEVFEEAGAGGLAIGMEQAGFESVLLNEIDAAACKTLRKNRPNWNVVEGDIAKLDFTPYRDQIDILSGGFPCQAFSYAGKKLGFEDTRGTLFFEFARAVKETNPKVFVAENVRGLLAHDEGRTLAAITDIIDELGYYLVPPRVLKAVFYKVPQKRERLFLIGIRKDLADKVEFHWPSPYHRILTLQDALKAGELYKDDVPQSPGQKYPQRKAEIMAQVPAGGYWKDLPPPGVCGRTRVSAPVERY